MNEVKMKKCSRCGEILELNEKNFSKRKNSKDGFRNQCKECRKRSRLKQSGVKEGYRRCKDCEEIKELKQENFSFSSRNKDGFLYICKECQIKNRGNVKNQGYKICNKCNRELPLDNIHYQENDLCLDSFRNICKECNGGRFAAPSRVAWTEEDDFILKENYPFMPTKDISRRFFSDRDPKQITEHATKILNLKKDDEYLRYRYWSKDDLEYLIYNYSDTDTSEISETLNKSEGTIRVKASQLDIRKDIWWNELEDEILINNYSNMKDKELVNVYFPNKTISSIRNRAKLLGLTKDEKYLRNMKKEIGIENLKNIPDMSGENSPRWVDRITVKCAQCNIDIKIKPSDLNNKDNKFCSRECSAKWKSENLSGENSPMYGIASDLWTEEMKLAAAERAIKRLKESDFSFSRTKPQIMIDELLDSMEIMYENEYECKYYLIDNYLLDYDLMIEVQGNFYHCNPVINLENSRESKILRKDKAKHTYVKKYKNIEILYLWEKDIYENIDLCKKLIEEYIKRNGDLKNYHSFNYVLNNNDGIELLSDLYEIGY